MNGFAPVRDGLGFVLKSRFFRKWPLNIIPLQCPMSCHMPPRTWHCFRTGLNQKVPSQSLNISVTCFNKQSRHCSLFVQSRYTVLSKLDGPATCSCCLAKRSHFLIAFAIPFFSPTDHPLGSSLLQLHTCGIQVRKCVLFYFFWLELLHQWKTSTTPWVKTSTSI